MSGVCLLKCYSWFYKKMEALIPKRRIYLITAPLESVMVPLIFEKKEK